MGTGMAHGVRLRGGKAEWYRNRTILSDTVAAALGRPGLPGPRNGARENTANTNIVDMGGKTYAIVEAGGLPVELSYTLDSIARSDLGGTLRHGFAAHPKHDPRTGLHHVLTYEPGLEALTYLVVDARGRARDVAAIPAPHGPMVHDVAFTATRLIVLDLPVTFDKSAAARGFPFAWNPERMPRVGLLPLDGDLARLVWVEAPSCYVFHVMNAFDDGDAVIVDVVRHPRVFDHKRSGPGEGAPMLARWRVDPTTGRLSETILEERGCEFPRFNDAFAGRAYGHGYSVSLRGRDTYGPLLKHDVARGRAEAHDFGPGRVSLEPVFVARPGAVAEDDGWILCYVYDAARDASDVVILDARDFSGPPVATITLPVRVPFGFHGNWLPDQA
jgi:carotenoid cleavage dioxygenase